MDGFDFGKLFSFDGRIGRKTFWQLALMMFAVNLVIYIPFFLSDSLQIVVSLVAIVVYLVVAVAGLATTVKRLHDRGKSGWFYFVSLIPFIGPVWLLVEVGFVEGQPGENRYGAPGSGSPFAGDAMPATYAATAPSWNGQ